jgi:hypothetical protein
VSGQIGQLADLHRDDALKARPASHPLGLDGGVQSQQWVCEAIFVTSEVIAAMSSLTLERRSSSSVRRFISRSRQFTDHRLQPVTAGLDDGGLAAGSGGGDPAARCPRT